MWIGPFDEYMRRNDFREGVGAVLDLSPAQEAALLEHLKEYGKKNGYDDLGANRSDSVETGLEELGFKLGINLFPVGLGEAIEEIGLVKSYNFYPRSPQHPAAGRWESAPWAR
jgi:hypothetical protein